MFDITKRDVLIVVGTLVIAILVSWGFARAGEETCVLQERLARLGYYDGDQDCQMGPQTIRAIKALQRDRGLVVDGVLGEDTRKALFSGERRGRPHEDDRGSDFHRRADLSDERCADIVVEGTVLRATESRGKTGAVKAWEQEVLRKDGLGLNYSTWGDATDSSLRCKEIASWQWNCSAKARPCRGN